MNLLKTISVSMCMLILPIFVAAGQESRRTVLDSASTAAINGKVREYLNAIVAEPVGVQQEEIDFLIGTCSDSLVRQAVALDIYSYYMESKVMGVEALAVYMCDKWFIPGKIKMRDNAELMGAKIFAQFNRSSLLGMNAPEFTLLDSLGNRVSLFGSTGNIASGRYSILYFYSTDCAKCRMETILLRNILENDNFDADFYAINTGRNRAEWLRYVRLQMDIDAPSTRIYHLWDPEMTSDFQIKYGILQTPGMFLVSPEGKILGRKLDALSLEKLLSTITQPAVLDYGGKESEMFFDSVFKPFGDSLKCSDVRMISGHIQDRTLKNGDTVLFRQMTGDLMYYLSNRRGQAYKCGLESLVKNQILGSDVWKSRDDSLKVVSFASILDDLLSKLPEGSPVPDIKVPAEMKKAGKDGPVSRKGRYSLGKIGGKENIIIFHTEGCPVCKSEIEAADSLLAKRENRKLRVLLVDMDMLFSSYPETADAVMEAFDLTSLPLIIITDRKGTVSEKYAELAG